MYFSVNSDHFVILILLCQLIFLIRLGFKCIGLFHLEVCIDVLDAQQHTLIRGLLNLQDLRPTLKAHRTLLICLCWIIGFVKNNEHLMLQKLNNDV